MGGSINVAIRFRSGEAVCVERWTNNMPWWFRNLKMYQGDETHVREYLAMTRNNDYLADPHATGRPQSLQNGGYGLIVWDYMTNTILDNNSYSDPLMWDPVQLVELGHENRRKWTSPEQVELNPQFLEIANAGIVRLLVYEWPQDESLTSDQRDAAMTRTITEKLPPEQAILEAQRAWYAEWGFENRDREARHRYVKIAAEPTPMTYRHFPQDVAGTKAMRDELKALGFPFSRKEGLNANIQLPRARKITEQERLAREIWQTLKKEDEKYKDLDGVAFDALTKESQEGLKGMAEQMMKDPDMVRNYRLQEFMKYSVSMKVGITIGT
jgi:RNAse (barnase) inhibitor barstar